MEASSTLIDRVLSYPVDILTNGDWDALKQASEAYLVRLRGSNEESTDWFSLTNGEKLAVTPSSVTTLHIHKDVPGHWIPALLNLRDKEAVVALYLDGRWWSLENVLRTSNSARQGLVQVHSVAEQIVLYLLNRIIYRKREFLPGDVQFLCHPAKQFAKVFWRNGQGIGLKILQDFCSTFREDEAVAISRPISGAMYGVCSKYLQSRPHERDRIWQVEAPGDWSQRVNVWLQIQMGDLPSINAPGDGDSSPPSPEGENSQGSTNVNTTRQSLCVGICDPHCEVILEPSEEVASGSQTRKGENSGESNVTEGETAESRNDTETTTGRKRQLAGLSPASGSKQVKLTGSPLRD